MGDSARLLRLRNSIGGYHRIPAEFPVPQADALNTKIV